MRPGQVNARIEGGGRAHQRLQRDRSGQIGNLRHAQAARHRQPAHSGHRLGAVQQRQALLGRQNQRLQARPAQRLASGHPLAFVKRLALADHHQRQMSQRRQIPARAHRTLLRNHRMHPGIEQRHQQLHQRRTAAAEAFGQYIGAQQQHGPRLGLGERLAHSAGVAAHQIALQLRQTLRRNAHIRQLAKAGIDPIDLLPGTPQSLQSASDWRPRAPERRAQRPPAAESSETASISARVRGWPSKIKQSIGRIIGRRSPMVQIDCTVTLVDYV